MTEIKLNVLVNTKLALENMRGKLEDIKISLCVLETYIEQEVKRVSDI